MRKKCQVSSYFTQKQRQPSSSSENRTAESDADGADGGSDGNGAADDDGDDGAEVDSTQKISKSA